MSHLIVPAGQPVGVPYWHAGPSSTIPANHGILDGSAVPRSYAALWALWGTTHGAGDGSTTFNLPDMRGRSPIGIDGGAGVVAAAWASVEGGKGGEELHALTAAENGPHTHTVGDYNAGAGGGTADWLASNPTTGTKATSSSGSGTPHNNMPPGIAGYWCARLY